MFATLAGGCVGDPRTLARVITAAHAIIYADDAEQARAFFRDVLQLPNLDAGDGWLIFRLPPSELGVHPSGAAAQSGHHELYLMCDDIETTMAQLEAKGVEFVEGIADRGFGLLATLKVPGGGTLGLYEPKHATAEGL